MKAFNQMTEKQMANAKGGEIVLMVLAILSFIVTPLAIGGGVGYGVYEGTKNNTK